MTIVNSSTAATAADARKTSATNGAEGGAFRAVSYTHLRAHET